MSVSDEIGYKHQVQLRFSAISCKLSISPPRLASPNTTRSHYNSLYNMKKNNWSDYVITGRPTWVGKSWPGSVTGVACYG